MFARLRTSASSDAGRPKERIAALKQASRRGPIRAFKVVRKRGAQLEGPSQYGYGFNYKTGYQTNEVTQQKVSRYANPVYERAFHVFATRSGAESFYNDLHSAETELRVIPCLVWDIVAAGKQAGCSVIVARKMILLTDY